MYFCMVTNFLYVTGIWKTLIVGILTWFFGPELEVSLGMVMNILAIIIPGVGLICMKMLETQHDEEIVPVVNTKEA